MNEEAASVRAAAAQAGITLSLRMHTDVLGTTPLGWCGVSTPLATPAAALTEDWRRKLLAVREGVIDLLYGECADGYWPPVPTRTSAQAWARGLGDVPVKELV